MFAPCICVTHGRHVCLDICVDHLANHLKGFEDFLKFNFNRSVGKSWVEAGQYTIRDESASEGGILTAKEWNKSIKAGMTVSMAMVLRRSAAANTTEHDCPSCNSPYRGLKSKDLEIVQWLVYVLSLITQYVTADYFRTRVARIALSFFKSHRNQEL